METWPLQGLGGVALVFLITDYLFWETNAMKDEIDHLSVSQVNEYLGCSQQYFYHRIAELDPCDVSSSLVVGSAFHAALEHFNIMKKKRVQVNHSELSAVFEQYILDESKACDINWGKTSKENVLFEGGRWLQTFLETDNPKEKVLQVEESFELKLPEMPIPIVGRVDLVVEDEDGAVCVIDYKTASAKPSANDIASNLQMTLYGLWAKRRYPGRVINLRMDYLIKSKRAPSMQKYESVRTEIQEQALVMLFRKVYNHISMLRAEVIDPLPVASWKCIGCGFRKLCNFKLDTAA